MERTVDKLNESFNRINFRFQGTTERDEWLRTFPDPMPPGVRLVFVWHDQMNMSVHPEEIKPEDVTLKPNPDGHAAVRARIVEELSKLDRPGLETRAAEIGVEVKPGWNVAHLRAAIASKLAPAEGDATGAAK